LTSIVGKKILWKSMESINCFGYPYSSKYSLCSTEERNSSRFGTTWDWVHNNKMFIFGWTIPLRLVIDLSRWRFIKRPLTKLKSNNKTRNCGRFSEALCSLTPQKSILQPSFTHWNIYFTKIWKRQADTDIKQMQKQLFFLSMAANWNL